MINDPRCFELYGYDILLDENLKPWMMEVNVSPSLGVTAPWDQQLKQQLVDDCVSIVFPDKENVE